MPPNPFSSAQLYSYFLFCIINCFEIILVFYYLLLLLLLLLLILLLGPCYIFISKIIKQRPPFWKEGMRFQCLLISILFQIQSTAISWFDTRWCHLPEPLYSWLEAEFKDIFRASRGIAKHFKVCIHIQFRNYCGLSIPLLLCVHSAKTCVAFPPSSSLGIRRYVFVLISSSLF